MAQAAADLIVKSVPKTLPDDAAGLLALYDAYGAARYGYLAIINQPRCQDSALKLIEAELERCDVAQDQIIAKIKSLKTIDKYTRSRAMARIVDYADECGESEAVMLRDIAAIAAKPAPKDLN
jgi:hypothetical protein